MLIELGEFERTVLLAVLRLNGNAYGVTIRREIMRRTGREQAHGSLYAALDRLEAKGLVSSRFGDPTPQRGGQAKRYFTVSALGMEAARSEGRCVENRWDGLRAPGVAHA